MHRGAGYWNAGGIDRRERPQSKGGVGNYDTAGWQGGGDTPAIEGGKLRRTLDVGGAVTAEAGAGQDHLDARRDGIRLAGDGHHGRQSLGHLGREGGTAEEGQLRMHVWRQHPFQNLVGGLQRVVQNALCAGHQDLRGSPQSTRSPHTLIPFGQKCHWGQFFFFFLISGGSTPLQYPVKEGFQRVVPDAVLCRTP